MIRSRRSIILSAFFLIVIIFLATLFIVRFTPRHSLQSLDAPCVLYYGDTRYENVDGNIIDQLLETPFAQGDTLTFERTIPAIDPTVPSPTLAVSTSYCALEVLIDGERVYASGLEQAARKGFLGEMIHFIPLHPEDSGKELRISYTVTSRFMVSSFSPPIIGSYEDLAGNHLSSYSYALFIGIFLCIFGAFFLMISLVFSVLKRGIPGQIISAILCLDMGVFTLSTVYLTPFFMFGENGTFLSYVSMYLLVPLFYLLIARIHRQHRTIIYLIIAGLSSVLVFLFIVLHYIPSLQISDFWYPFLAVAVVQVGVVIYYDITDAGDKRASTRQVIQMAGPSVFAFISIPAGLSYLLPYLPNAINKRIAYSLFISGMLFFSLTRFMIYLVYLREASGRQKEIGTLSQVAYVDKMTGLPNRARCDDKFHELDTGNLDFCIVSLDLNGLKFVNDNYGHDAGDRLLRSFASVMTASFGGVGLCCRMGGDEFLVVIDNITEKAVRDRINHMLTLLKKLDEQDSTVKHSAAYGFAYKHELPDGDAHDVYMLADQRMYDIKVKQYETLGIPKRKSY